MHATHPTTPPEILTEAEAAEYLRVSASYLRASRLTKPRTHGPAWSKCGRAVRYRRADLDAWLVACQRTSAA